MAPIQLASIAVSVGLFACAPVVAQQQFAAQPSVWAGMPSIADFVKKEEAKLAAAQAAIAALSKVGGPRTIENTLDPFDNCRS